MPLTLTVPALEEKPLIVAETRPQKVLEFLSRLPSAPLEAATALRDEMEILNRQKVAADNRLRALDLYREHVVRLTDNLADAYRNSTLPLSRESKTHAAAAEALWLELSYGYKLALLDQIGQLFSPSDKTAALTIYHAMESLRRLSMVYYETYFSVPGSIWRDWHQLYFHAAQKSLHEFALTVDGKKTSIDLLYKQILLMALTDPQHLAPQDMEQVADYIARFAGHTQLQGLGILENPAGIFIIALDSDKPPIPYIKNVEQTDDSTDILFITVDLARLVHQHLQMLQSGNIARNSGLPENASDGRYQDMLVYLIKHWGVSPKRIYKRSNKNGRAQIGIGLTATHYFINNERHYQQPRTSDSAETAAPPTPGTPVKPSVWQVVNVSANGTALRKFPSVDASVRIGELLSIKSDNEPNWSVAVLRWAVNGEQEQLDIGTQLLAPKAEAIGIRLTNTDGAFEPALALPEMPSIKQAASIIARCGTYAPARVLELDQNGRISRILITKLVERTHSFERFQYSVL
ncbi:MAG TPA: hypothetical protein VIK69_01610 [Methylophilaceae bacterium]|jgi:hypothetical protein